MYVVNEELDRLRSCFCSSLVKMAADDSRPERYKINDDGWELIDCHIHAAKNWERMARGLLTVAKVRKFWAELGQYLNTLKKRQLAA